MAFERRLQSPSAILLQRPITGRLGTTEGFWSPLVHSCASTNMQQAHQATTSRFTGLALVRLSQGANCVHDLIRPKEDCHVCPIVLHGGNTPKLRTSGEHGLRAFWECFSVKSPSVLKQAISRCDLCLKHCNNCTRSQSDSLSIEE